MRKLYWTVKNLIKKLFVALEKDYAILLSMGQKKREEMNVELFSLP